jgi:hypothetical protein
MPAFPASLVFTWSMSYTFAAPFALTQRAP